METSGSQREGTCFVYWNFDFSIWGHKLKCSRQHVQTRTRVVQLRLERVPVWRPGGDQHYFVPHNFSFQRGTTKIRRRFPITSADGLTFTACQSPQVTGSRHWVPQWRVLMQMSLKCRETSDADSQSLKRSKSIAFHLVFHYRFEFISTESFLS